MINKKYTSAKSSIKKAIALKKDDVILDTAYNKDLGLLRMSGSMF